MPIRWRLTLFNALAIGTILVLLGLALVFLLQRALFSNVEETVRNRAFAAAAEVEREDDGDEAISADAAEDLTLDGVFIVVRDGEGGVLFQSVSLSSGERANDRVWSAALAADAPASGTADLSPEAPDFVYAVPVYPESHPARVVEAGTSYKAVAQTLSTFRAVLAAGILVAFLFSIVGAYFLARAALSPVEAVAAAARDMGDKDLSKRLPVADRRDEIGRLTAAINGLLARLEAAFSRREETLARQRRFVADASHELRTPLTSIGGYARMLEGWALEDKDTARESAAAIRRESERMHGLVEGLLALARGDEGPPMSPENADLAEVAEESAHAARASANGKVEVEYKSPEEPVGALFDRMRIRQAVAILLDNAIKYTPEGGRVTVKAFEENGWSAVAVEDTGVGIPEEHLPLVFERFHRVNRARGEGGAGLGLSIARQIAEAHGGNIEVESEPERGSSFTLSLPRPPGQLS